MSRIRRGRQAFERKALSMRWKILIGLSVLLLLGQASVAQADSVMTPATREGAGTGSDASAVTDFWSFTVSSMRGKPAFIIVSLRDPVTNKAVAFASTKPQPGKTFATNDPVPAGAYRLRAIIHGGPPHDGASVTLTVDTP